MSGITHPLPYVLSWLAEELIDFYCYDVQVNFFESILGELNAAHVHVG